MKSSIFSLVLFLGVLAALIFVFFVRPQQRFESTALQNTANIEAIQRAIEAWKTDHGGSADALFARLPGGIRGLRGESAARLLGSGVGEVDLCRELVPLYLGAIPYVPSQPGRFFYKGCASYETGYRISVDDVGRMTVK